MRKFVFSVLAGLFLFAGQASAQARTISGKVTSEDGTPIPDVTVLVKGTNVRTTTTSDGTYTIRAEPGQVLQFRTIGTTPTERTVGTQDFVNVQMARVVTSLNAVVVTALGQNATQRALGTAQQTVKGAAIAETQRENFVNALQGRIAGVDVTSTSGVPGASSSITIRGVSSISSSNQPLMIIDGLPMDNRTMNTNVLASDAPGSATAFNNRNIDFTNRGADLNPDDIETLTVLKGPEAAALYGIDAANGAIVITTKRGKAGAGWTYSNSFRIEKTSGQPDIQKKYSASCLTCGTTGQFQYFGQPYAAGTVFYDNMGNFFRRGTAQTHNLAFSGATQDGRINYRLATSSDRQSGVIPSSDYGRINLTGASQAQIANWLNTDVSMAYTYATNNQVYKGDISPLIGLMLWPVTDNAQDYATPAGVRRRLTTLAASSEVDNPFFNISHNKVNSKNGRILGNVGLTITPFSWGNLKSNIGVDSYTNQNLVLRNPESAAGAANNGILDVADLITRNINVQSLLNFNNRPLFGNLSISGLLGNAINDYRSNTDAAVGRDFLDPNFVSINNTNVRSGRTTLEQRRLVGAFGQAVFDYNKYLYVTVTGRNDWTSTIPKGRNSFFYPGVSSSFVFSDAFPSIGRH
ncbi:MAG TPA: TonB-dependent receptor plug domain-containing protein, partial [Gemmatimonadaceae bacterium]